MTDMEKNAAGLLDGVTGIVKQFEAKWRETGEKYNIFKIAGIAHKEVRMCRVLADLLDPRGQHRKGSLYLRLFWKVVASKPRNYPALDFEHTRVTAEYVIDDARRIDIAIEDGAIFVPIEVKIWAGDQPKQVTDYFGFTRTKNKTARIPVLYLTLDGHEPSDVSREDVGQDAYVCLSFKDDILPWLETCLGEEETKKTVPVRENLKQFIAAIKSLCGQEDAEMEDEIFKLVSRSEDTARAALSIGDAMGLFDQKAREAFVNAVVPLVTKALPDADYVADEGWYCISIPIRGGKNCFHVNYDWKSLMVNEGEIDAETAKRMSQKLAELTGGGAVWPNEGVVGINPRGYPTLASVDVRLYFYELYKLYTERPREVAEKILYIVRELEGLET